MKQQEQMIREMEQSVTRREFISYQGEAVSAKSGKKRLTKGTFQKKLQEIQRKIKGTQKVLERAPVCLEGEQLLGFY